MDLKIYYGKIREVLETIKEDFTVVVSRETPDGGKPGVAMETTKATAARMVVDGRARLATPEEAEAHRERERALSAKAKEEAAPPRMQVALLSEADLEAWQATRKNIAEKK